MKLSVSELIGLISTNLVPYSEDEIEIDTDYYWNLHHSEKFDMMNTPSLGVGSFEDDLRDIRLFQKEGVLFGAVELGKLAALLKLFANELEKD